MNHLKLAAGTLVVASLGTTLILEHRATARLRDEQVTLQRQAAPLALPASNLPLSSLGSPPSNTPAPLSAAQLDELERLRRQIAATRPLPAALETLQAENLRLRAASRLEPTDDPAEAEFNQITRWRVQELKKWCLMFRMHANEHAGQLPDSWEQVADSIPAAERAALIEFASNNFEIVFHGNESAVSNRVECILFREKQARRSPSGKWQKVYGHFDGSVSTQGTPDGDFEAFEKPLTFPPKQ